MNSKKGFTLVEMILSVSIIVILSSVVTVNITRYIEGANVAGEAAESHANKYDAAHAEVNALGYSAGVASPTPATPTPATPTPATPTPATPTPATPTPATPTPATPTPATPTPATPTPATPTPATPTPATIPPSYSTNHKVISENITSWNNGYNYRSTLTFPSSSNFQYLTVYIPTGAILTGDSRVKSISYSGTNTAIIKINKNQGGAIIDVKYTGTDYVMVITGVSY